MLYLDRHQDNDISLSLSWKSYIINLLDSFTAQRRFEAQKQEVCTSEHFWKSVQIKITSSSLKLQPPKTNNPIMWWMKKIKLENCSCAVLFQSCTAVLRQSACTAWENLSHDVTGCSSHWRGTSDASYVLIVGWELFLQTAGGGRGDLESIYSWNPINKIAWLSFWRKKSEDGEVGTAEERGVINAPHPQHPPELTPAIHVAQTREANGSRRSLEIGPRRC